MDMDAALSIMIGIAFRAMIDVCTCPNGALSANVVGLWESIVLLHFTSKNTRASGPWPYLACGVRVFGDLLMTQSIFKLAVVFLWITITLLIFAVPVDCQM
ncbi:hypothetical protein R3P38DRAFT_2894210 [Favolaschia claudopus]|uniref:Uncharacterized protein n=1 Tax=Favolaschia claudopus TaxID=2862362 RepID=A0AAW0CRX8_9AGAR